LQPSFANEAIDIQVDQRRAVALPCPRLVSRPLDHGLGGREFISSDEKEYKK